jgi:hypothetical protein
MKYVMKNSWQYIMLAPVIATALFILINLNKMEVYTQQCADSHSGAGSLTLGFTALGIIAGTVGFIMVVKKKFVLALGALIPVSVSFYGYTVLDKIQCRQCATA